MNEEESKSKGPKKAGRIAKAAVSLTVDTISGTIGSVFKVLGTILLIFLITGLLFACIFAYYEKTCLTPNTNISLEDYKLSESSTIYYQDSSGQWQELVTLADIAQHIHISTKQINRILQRDFSLSRRDYIDRIKCEHAKDLLLHTDMPLDEIATAIGYANVFSFNKFFRRVEGLPPGLFRRSHYSY